MSCTNTAAVNGCYAGGVAGTAGASTIEKCSGGQAAITSEGGVTGRILAVASAGHGTPELWTTLKLDDANADDHGMATVGALSYIGGTGISNLKVQSGTLYGAPARKSASACKIEIDTNARWLIGEIELDAGTYSASLDEQGRTEYAAYDENGKITGGLFYSDPSERLAGAYVAKNTGNVWIAVPDDSTYPEGVTRASFPESVSCTTWTGANSTAPAMAVYLDGAGQPVYVADITDAIDAGATEIWVKGGVSVRVNLSSQTNRTTDLTKNLTIHANGADFQYGEISVNMTAMGKAAAITLRVYDARNIYVWGASPTNGVTQNVILENCHNEGTSAIGTQGRMFYITGSTGTVHVMLKNCSVTKVESPVYMNCNGSVTVENCSFSESAAAIKLSLKAESGTTAVTVRNTTFDKCGWTTEVTGQSWLTEDSSSVKIKTKSSDGAALTLDNVAITNVIGSSSIVVDGEASYTGTTTVNALNVTVDGRAWTQSLPENVESSVTTQTP